MIWSDRVVRCGTSSVPPTLNICFEAKLSKAKQTNKVELRVESILNEPNTDINKLKRTVGLFNMLYASFRFIYSFAYSLCLEVSQSLSPNDYTKNVCMYVCACDGYAMFCFYVSMLF